MALLDGRGLEQVLLESFKRTLRFRKESASPDCIEAWWGIDAALDERVKIDNPMEFVSELSELVFSESIFM